MAEIKGAHIFSAGTWNDLTFTEADLDAIVAAFEALGSAGRVPLKFGHNDEQPITDGQPALGWVQRVWRDGKKLLADFANVPTTVFEAIKKELYKFVSIELLRDAERDGVKYPSVLDAVALLGADPPAVTDLEALSALALSRKETGLQFRARLAFTQGNPSFNITGVKHTMADDKTIEQALAPHLAELKELREKFSATEKDAKEKDAALKAAIDKLAAIEAKEKKDKIEANKSRFASLIERAVKSGKIKPAAQDDLYAEYLPNDEAALTLKFSALEALFGKEEDEPRNKRKVVGMSRSDNGGQIDGDLEQAKSKVTEIARELQAKGDKRDMFALTAHVLRIRPDLGRIIHSEILAGDR